VIMMKTHRLQVPRGLVFLPQAVVHTHQQLRNSQLLGKSQERAQHGFFPSPPHVFPLPRAFPEKVGCRLGVWLRPDLVVQIGQGFPAPAHQPRIHQVVHVPHLWLVKY